MISSQCPKCKKRFSCPVMDAANEMTYIQFDDTGECLVAYTGSDNSKFNRIPCGKLIKNPISRASLYFLRVREGHKNRIRKILTIGEINDLRV